MPRNFGEEAEALNVWMARREVYKSAYTDNPGEVIMLVGDKLGLLYVIRQSRVYKKGCREHEVYRGCGPREALAAFYKAAGLSKEVVKCPVKTTG